MTIDLDLGTAFGGISFVFESVSGEVTDTRAEEVNGQWRYFDFETGEPVSLEEPFRS